MKNIDIKNIDINNIDVEALKAKIARKYCIDPTGPDFERVDTAEGHPVYICDKLKHSGGAACIWDPYNGYTIAVSREVYEDKSTYFAFLYHELGHINNGDCIRTTVAAILGGRYRGTLEEEIKADAYAKAHGYGPALKAGLLHIANTNKLNEEQLETINARIAALDAE